MGWLKLRRCLPETKYIMINVAYTVASSANGNNIKESLPSKNVGRPRLCHNAWGALTAKLANEGCKGLIDTSVFAGLRLKKSSWRCAINPGKFKAGEIIGKIKKSDTPMEYNAVNTTKGLKGSL